MIAVVAVAVAMSGLIGGALGHPIEYITLNTVDPTIPTDCKYCGLRFVRDPDFHH